MPGLAAFSSHVYHFSKNETLEKIDEKVRKSYAALPLESVLDGIIIHYENGIILTFESSILWEKGLLCSVSELNHNVCESMKNLDGRMGSRGSFFFACPPATTKKQ